MEKNTLSTDVKTCDNYLLLAVHYLMDIIYERDSSSTSADSGDSSDTVDPNLVYLRALDWLSEGIKLSPSTHQITVLLIYIYSALGMCE